MEDDSKYLSADYNPMIPGRPGQPGHQNRSEAEDPYLSPDHNPMIPCSESDYSRESFDLSPDEIQARFSLRYPGVNEITLGPYSVVRMGDESYQVDGTPLKVAPANILADLSNALTSDNR